MTLLPPPVVRCNSDEAYDTLLFKEREPGTWYEPLAGKVARKEDFALNQAAMVTWAPKELEQELGTCEIVLTLIKLPAEEAMIQWGISDDGGNAVMMAYHTYKCPHLCCKPVFMKEGLSSLSGGTYENMFLCPCHLSRFDPLSIVEATDELGRKVMVAELVEAYGAKTVGHGADAARLSMTRASSCPRSFPKSISGLPAMAATRRLVRTPSR